MKRLASLVLLLTLCLNSAITGNAAVLGKSVSDDNVSNFVGELYCLGVVNERSLDMSETVTRAEMVRYVVGLMGLDESSLVKGVIGFSDVPDEHPLSGYINLAKECGVVSGDGVDVFKPNDAVLFEEALKMVTTVLGYSDYAESMGGYPAGYFVTSNTLLNGLLSGVDCPAGGKLLKRDAVILLKNALTIPLFTKKIAVLPTGVTQYRYVASAEDETALYRNFGITVYKAQIEKYDEKSNSITVTGISAKTDKTKAELTSGETVDLNLSKKVDFGDYEHIIAEIWVDAEETVLYLLPDRDIKIVSGYIDEVDQQHVKGAKHDPRYIASLAIIGQDEYLGFAPGCTFYYNDKPVSSGGIPLIGSYGRAILYKDEIMVLEAWTLSEGGIISNVDDDVLTYTRGEREGLKMDNIFEYKNISVVLNGNKTEYWALHNDFLFDYYADADKDRLIFVVSTHIITDNFSGISSDYAYFGDITYSFSEQYRVYYSGNGVTYNLSASAEDILNKTITAHLDYEGFVRYVKPAYSDEANLEFYGFITGYKQGGISEDQIRLCRVYKDKTVELIYELNKRVTMGDGITIDTLQSDLQSVYQASGDINDKLKTVDLLYKFELNEKGKIVSIQHPNRFDNSPATGVSVVEFSGQNYPNISSPRIYFDGARICAFYYDGDLKVKLLSWKDLMYKNCTNIRMDFYCEVNSSEIEIALIRGNVASIGYGREPYVRYGLITHLSKALDAKTGNQLVKVEIDGKSYRMSSKNAENLKANTYVVFGETGSVFDEETDLVIRNAYDLSGDPNEWSIVGGTTEGLHGGVLEKLDNRRIFLTDGSRYYMGKDISFYEISDNDRIIPCEQSDVYDGASVWCLLYFSEIRAVFFK